MSVKHQNWRWLYSEKIFKTQRLSKNGVTGVTGVTKNTNVDLIGFSEGFWLHLRGEMVTPVTPCNSSVIKKVQLKV